MNYPRLCLISLECPDPDALALFYSALTGIPVDPSQNYAPDVDLLHDSVPGLSFQRVADFVAPTWPHGDRPKQLHLDFEVDDLDEGERHVLGIGARKAGHQPGQTFRVFLDPVGHPFCLTLKSD